MTKHLILLAIPMLLAAGCSFGEDKYVTWEALDKDFINRKELELKIEAEMRKNASRELAAARNEILGKFKESEGLEAEIEALNKKLADSSDALAAYVEDYEKQKTDIAQMLESHRKRLNDLGGSSSGKTTADLIKDAEKELRQAVAQLLQKRITGTADVAKKLTAPKKAEAPK